MSKEVIGQLVAPQNTAVIPTAEQSSGGNPIREEIAHPNVAPTKKLGTISPPLNPAPRVRAVSRYKFLFR